MTRQLNLADLPKLERIHKREFPLPNVTDPSYIIGRALVSDNELRGACFARLTSELILVLEENLSNFTRARLLKEASEIFIKNLLARGIKSTHLFITPEADEHYVKLLEEHFGFVRTTGTPLYLEVK